MPERIVIELSGVFELTYCESCILCFLTNSHSWYSPWCTIEFTCLDLCVPCILTITS